MIIGGDAAGLSAATQIRRHQPEASIGVLEKGNVISYGACGLPYFIGGEIEKLDDLVFFTPEKFSAQYRCDLKIKHEVIAIEPSSQTVIARSDDGERKFRYDYCMLATGAHAVQLPMALPDQKSIFYLKTIQDAAQIKERLAKLPAQEIAIIGAGYIGLEMVEAFTSLGHRCAVLDMAATPVPRLHPTIGKRLVKMLEEKNIPFYGNCKIESTSIKDQKVEIETDSETFRADLLLVAPGIRPATDFLTDTEIKTNRGAVEINRFGQTSVENIYAGGDCAMVYHRLLQKNVYHPLGSTANKQGRIAGLNLSGQKLSFPGIIGMQIFKFFDIVVGSCGIDPETGKANNLDIKAVAARRSSRAGYYPGGEPVDLSLYVNSSNRTIVGGHLMGPLESSQLIDVIGVMAQTEVNVDEAAWFDAAYAPPVAPVWNALLSAAGKYK